ncbi:MAG TPA: energy transducer TonB [Opitutaceae bacterium]|nr:energy transducer TonB [Opitutaceae bacterium]
MKSLHRYLIALCLFVVLGALSVHAQDANGVYSKVDESPVPVKTPPPKYPFAMRRDKISGIVTVAVIIDEKGNVIDATISKSSNPEFEAPSLEAVKSWHFKPAKVGGKEVKVRVVIPLKYDFQE